MVFVILCFRFSFNRHCLAGRTPCCSCRCGENVRFCCAVILFRFFFASFSLPVCPCLCWTGAKGKERIAQGQRTCMPFCNVTPAEVSLLQDTLRERESNGVAIADHIVMVAEDVMRRYVKERTSHRCVADDDGSATAVSPS
ncbi:hypothetical protein DQ04_01031050 [Trypanosoma grayi]|uniref:hypothetical protein n=1 Tax=Trypanosoma grayi TaxID=71804 RepID=UPI0004F49CEE|nr:hypothetical protein DQ04_01031050 [Trypanosoma grayi]KEG13392.1 hypothetical protein DQ04_01031050 [Trypanosoma grayi]